MNIPNFIGIGGPAGSGKTTAAQILNKRIGYEIRPLATPIRKMLSVLVGDDAYGPKSKPHPYLGNKTIREALARLGFDWGRVSMDPDIWVSAWARSVGASPSYLVIDDMRYINEAELIKKLGGITILIDRGYEPHEIGEPEVMLIDYDYVVENKGTVEELEKKLLEIVR